MLKGSFIDIFRLETETYHAMDISIIHENYNFLLSIP